MKKVLFDASIHLGQFCITDEKVRIACKNSQASISTKPGEEVIGVISFEENSWSDHIIWGLEREIQDVFYKFMDIFHSVKQIERIPISKEDATFALEISKTTGLDMGNALSCAVAVSQKTYEIHTYYPSLLDKKVVEFFNSKYGISISVPPPGLGSLYQENNLEQYYQEALTSFQDNGLNLFRSLHT